MDEKSEVDAVTERLMKSGIEYAHARSIALEIVMWSPEDQRKITAHLLKGEGNVARHLVQLVKLVETLHERVKVLEASLGLRSRAQRPGSGG